MASSWGWDYGINGPPGPQGPVGPQGRKGDTGAEGPTGPQGIDGTAVNTGATGYTGPQGIQGIQGIQGVQGVQGIQGPAGQNGGTFLYLATASVNSLTGTMEFSPSPTPRSKVNSLATTSPTLIGTFVTPPGALITAFVPGGVWNLTLSLTTDKAFSLSFELVYTDPDGESNPVLIGKSNDSTPVPITPTETEYSDAIIVVDTTLPDIADRLRINIYGVASSPVTNITTYFGEYNTSRVQSTLLSNSPTGPPGPQGPLGPTGPAGQAGVTGLIPNQFVYGSSATTLASASQLVLNQGVVFGKGLSAFMFGSGRDGDVSVGGGQTLVLSRDMYYNSLTIASGGTIDASGYRIYVKNTLTNAGIIHNYGRNGAQPTFGSAGGAGGKTGTLGGGGAGGAGIGPPFAGGVSNALGGIGGGASPAPVRPSVGDGWIGGAFYGFDAPPSIWTGRGASTGTVFYGGSGGSGNAGGGGGGGGGVAIFCQYLTGGGTINVSGGSGADDPLNPDVGGGGGGGGFILIVAIAILSQNYNVSGGGSPLPSGGNGASGYLKVITV